MRGRGNCVEVWRAGGDIEILCLEAAMCCVELCVLRLSCVMLCCDPVS